MGFLNQPKTVLVVLLLSLGINFVVLGIALAPVVHGKPDAPRPMLEKVLKFAGKVPPEMRQAVRRHLREHRDELRQAHDSMRDNRAAIVQLVQQPKLDENALRQKLTEQRETMNKVVGILQDGFIAVLQDVPPEERVRVTQALLKDFGATPPLPPHEERAAPEPDDRAAPVPSPEPPKP